MAARTTAPGETDTSAKTTLTMGQVLTLLQDRTEELHQVLQAQRGSYEANARQLDEYRGLVDDATAAMAQLATMLRWHAWMTSAPVVVLAAAAVLLYWLGR